MIPQPQTRRALWAPMLFLVLGVAPLFVSNGPVIPYLALLFAVFLLTAEGIHPLRLVPYLLPAAVTGAAYALFFSKAVSRFVWSRNKAVDPASLTPWIRDWYSHPRDGIELYVLYALTLAVVAASVWLALRFRRLQDARLQLVAAAVTGTVAILLLGEIGWTPPHGAIHAGLAGRLLLILAVAALWAFFSLEGRFPRLRFWLLPAVLAPVCFIPWGDGISVIDYAYIFEPALRLMAGVPLSEVYLQYDLLLSLLCMPFLALKANPVAVQVLAQGSLFLMFLAIIFYARKWMAHRPLLVAMVLAMALARCYGLLHDPTNLLQVTPLRLDWWLLLVVVIYAKGRYHWTVGLSLGLLLVFHKTFGMIYALAYLQGLGVFLLLAIHQRHQPGGLTRAIRGALREEGSRAWVTLAILGAAYALSALLFNRVGLSEAAQDYRQLGIGFDRIGRASFYWYVPILFGACALLLHRLRGILTEKYFVNGVFLILFGIGNSIYFFGRSHEHNLLNLSTLLLLVLFLVVDMVRLCFDRPQRPAGGLAQSALFVLPLVILLHVADRYSGNLLDRPRPGEAPGRPGAQWRKLSSGHLYNFKEHEIDLGALREATRGSPKVFVMLGSDFPVYYGGGYVPPATFSPYFSWIHKGALVAHAQRLLDEGYFVVCSDAKDEIIRELKYTNATQAGPHLVLSRSSGPKTARD